MDDPGGVDESRLAEQRAPLRIDAQLQAAGWLVEDSGSKDLFAGRGVGRLVVRLQNIGDGEFKDAEAFVSLDHYETLNAHDVRLGDVVSRHSGINCPGRL